MSNMGNYGLIILTPPINPDFMSKYQKNIGPSKGLVTLYIMLVHTTKERGKSPMGKSSLKHGQKNKSFGNIVINHAS